MMDKVVNGYGISTSTHSITFVGNASATEFAEKQMQRRQVIKQEAIKITNQTEALHPCRKVLFMQSNYPETVRRLQGAYQPASHQPVTSRQYARNQRISRNEKTIQEHMAALTEDVNKEYAWNFRRQRYASLLLGKMSASPLPLPSPGTINREVGKPP